MPNKTKRATKQPSTIDEDEHGSPPVEPAGHICTVAFCPIGLALSAVEPLKPDVVEHLLVAGRELLLAAKAVLDARADGFAWDGGSSTLEKIDIG